MMLWLLLLAATALKALCIPAYRSTDFEVHRNWLAITHTKPWREWYTDGASPSEWTLDYPPLFALFEWALSQLAPLFDPAMLSVTNLNYASDATVLFQRLTVIASEALLLWATWRATRGLSRNRRLLAFFLVAAHPGLIMVDHIHFQYNGALLGLFLLSIWAVAGGQELAGAAVFAALLCAKHIFLYAAPAFFVHLLRRGCAGPLREAAPGLVALAAVVSAVFALSFGPFIAAGQLPQLAERLFPVTRGLCHAYWAPNFWALYAAADKALAALLPRLGLGSLVRAQPGGASMTGGLVGVAEFAALPQVGSGAAALCTLAAMAPCLLSTWRRPTPSRFPRAAVFCTLSAFLFGYHVHEKAILMALIPLAVLAGAGADTAAPAEFAFLSTVGTYSLFPLLFRPEEYLVKAMLLVAYTALALPWLADPDVWQKLIQEGPSRSAAGGGVSHPVGGAPGGSGGGSKGADGGRVAEKVSGGGGEVTHPISQRMGGVGGGSPGKARRQLRQRLRQEKKEARPVLSLQETFYLAGLVPLELYCSAGHYVAFGHGLPFLPLLLTSVYCSLGVVYCWYRMAERYCSELWPQLSWRWSREPHSS